MPNSEFALLVVNSYGHLRVLYCPIRVCCIEPVGTFQVGTMVWVERIITAQHPRGKFLYQIYGKVYLFECFAIQINF